MCGETPVKLYTLSNVSPNNCTVSDGYTPAGLYADLFTTHSPCREHVDKSEYILRMTNFVLDDSAHCLTRQRSSGLEKSKGLTLYPIGDDSVNTMDISTR
jgi:hypothetical protein